MASGGIRSSLWNLVEFQLTLFWDVQIPTLQISRKAHLNERATRVEILITSVAECSVEAMSCCSPGGMNRNGHKFGCWGRVELGVGTSREPWGGAKLSLCLQ
jgi:hypothetical protein